MKRSKPFNALGSVAFLVGLVLWETGPYSVFIGIMFASTLMLAAGFYFQVMERRSSTQQS